MLKVSGVDITNKQDLKKFIYFPFALYKNCPQWVPPLVSDIYKSFNPKKHPYFQHSQAKLFIAEKNNTTVGRISVFDNHRFNEFRNDSTAFSGFYDANESRPCGLISMVLEFCRSSRAQERMRFSIQRWIKR